jgi:hypothetical protein
VHTARSESDVTNWFSKEPHQQQHIDIIRSPGILILLTIGNFHFDAFAGCFSHRGR